MKTEITKTNLKQTEQHTKKTFKKTKNTKNANA